MTGTERNNTLYALQSQVLAFTLMYNIYKDKKPILDHVKLHKMHHYNNKFEESKREILENIPQIMTGWTEYDDETIYLSVKGLFIESTGEENFIHSWMLHFIQNKHPQHFVN